MITDSQTNKLYLADCLPKKQPAFYERFKTVLNRCNIYPDLLPDTKDIWARDYMPIQIDADKFVQFVYNPDYLQSKSGQKTISDVDSICQTLNIPRQESKIVLDGGNVVRASDKVIMTDKVFYEKPNEEWDRNKLIKELRELFRVDKVVFIPQQPHDFTGHADGIVRFLDDKTVLINDYSKKEEGYKRALLLALDKAGLDYIPIPYNPNGNNSYESANGIYINYLQMDGVVILPEFGLDEDDRAFRQFETLFTGYKIEAVDSNEIAEEGGILNCISWNIKIDK